MARGAPVTARALSAMSRHCTRTRSEIPRIRILNRPASRGLAQGSSQRGSEGRIPEDIAHALGDRGEDPLADKELLPHLAERKAERKGRDRHPRWAVED